MSNPDEPLVYIIVLNYNTADDTIACLKSIKEIAYQNYKVVVIDNASTDNSENKITHYLKDFSTYSYIQTGYNGGYGYGNNIGIKYALRDGAEYLLILNNDTVVTTDFLKPMIDVAKNDKTIGIVSGKIYQFDDPNRIWFYGGSFNKCRGRVEHYHFNTLDVGQGISQTVTFISGCMWLIPRDVFLKVGYINEEYFMYVEDVDFSQRVIDAGYRLEVVSESIIYHKISKSTLTQDRGFSLYWQVKNTYKMIGKTKPTRCRYQAFLCYSLRTVLYLLKNKKFYLFRCFFKAFHDFWKESA